MKSKGGLQVPLIDMTPETRSMESGNPSKILGYNGPRVWSSGKGAEPLLGSVVGKWAGAPADVLTAVWAEPFHLRSM